MHNSAGVVKIEYSKVKLIIILGLISMLMPLSIDMYLPSFPTIAEEFSVGDGMVQLTVSSYLLGFGLGQLFFGPLSDSFGRKPIILFGLGFFFLAAIGCALSQSIYQLITIRFIHGIVAASCVVVINALLRDLFEKEEFSRMMSFVTLVMTIAPLLAPILGGHLLVWFDWHAIFWALAIAVLFVAIMVVFFIPETTLKENRNRFHLSTTIRQFISLLRYRKIFFYMLSGAFGGVGLFSFISLGPFVYINLHGVSEANFGYYFGVNIIALVLMTSLNTLFVKRIGVINMLKVGLAVQSVMCFLMLLVTLFDLGFIPLVLTIAGYMGCLSLVGSNMMALTLADYPYMAGTVSSLAGTLRFFLAGVVGVILASFTHNTSSRVVAGSEHAADVVSKFPEWLMVGSIVMSVSLAVLFFYLGYTLSNKVTNTNKV